MKIPCSIVQDLLPLYIEGMEREESRGHIEEHLLECQDCRKEFEDMQKTDIIVPDNDIVPLKKIKKTLQKKRLRAILVAVVLSLTFAFLCFRYVTKPRELPYEEDMFTFTTDENGVVTGTINRPFSAWYMEGTTDSQGTGGTTYHISVWTNYLSQWKTDYILETSFVVNRDKTPIAAVYYSEGEGTEDVLVYSKEEK